MIRLTVQVFQISIMESKMGGFSMKEMASADAYPLVRGEFQYHGDKWVQAAFALLHE